MAGQLALILMTRLRIPTSFLVVFAKTLLVGNDVKSMKSTPRLNQLDFLQRKDGSKKLSL